MVNVASPQQIDYNAVVADNLRAELARARWTGRKAAQALGLSNNWVQRRLSGETALEPNDIALFASFLDIPVERLFVVEKQKAPTKMVRAVESDQLPELDSNQQPAGYGLAPVTRLPITMPATSDNQGLATIHHLPSKERA